MAPSSEQLIPLSSNDPKEIVFHSLKLQTANYSLEVPLLHRNHNGKANIFEFNLLYYMYNR